MIRSEINYPILKHLIFRFSIFLCLIFLFNTSIFGQNFFISGGHDFSTALCSNGKVLVWGANGFNQQLGNSGGDGITPAPLIINSQIKQVDAGSGAFGIAVGCAGEVWTWGEPSNVRGAGPGGNTGKDPNQVVGLNGTGTLSNVRYVNASTSCAYAVLSTGELVSWGKNENGQMGNGTTNESSIPVYVKTNATTNLTGVIQVEGADNAGYALVDTDGDGLGIVYSWGDDTGGQLGRDVANKNFAQPVLRADNGQPLDNIVSISGGDKHCLALDGNGNVWAWGEDGFGGQVGTGVGTVNVPKAIKVIAGRTQDKGYSFLSDVISITAGQSFSMAVLGTGEVVVWGDIQSGTAYDFSIASDPAAVTSGKVPFPVYLKNADGSRVTGIRSVSDGEWWAFLIGNDGKLFVVGYGPDGALGVSGVTGTKSPIPLVLPSCDVADPCPVAFLGKDRSICPGQPITLSAGSINSKYVYTWYLNGNQISKTNGVAGATLEISEVGTYKVVVSSPISNTCAAPCPDDSDEIIITAIKAPNVPKATYCNGVITPDYTGLSAGSQFEWWTTQQIGTGTQLLGPPPNTASPNPVSVSYTTGQVTKTGTDANGKDIYTVYAEDKTILKTTVGPTSQPTCATASRGGQSSQKFTVYHAIKLDSITISYKTDDPNSPTPATLSIYSSKPSATPAPTPVFTKAISLEPAADMRDLIIPIGYSFPAPANAGGSEYWMSINGNFPVRIYKGCAETSYFDVATNGSLASINGGIENGNNMDPDVLGAAYNWKISSSTLYPCGRIPVEIKESCPLCKKPTSFAFTSTAKNICSVPATNKIDITVGAVTPATPGGVAGASYLYQWYKDNVPMPGVAQTVQSISATASGVYRVRVADKDTTTGSGCYVDSMVTLTFQTPIVQPALTDKDTLCAGATSLKEFGSASVPAGGVKPYAYQWQSSTGGATYQNIPGATTQSFKPLAPSATTYYKRVIADALCGASTSDSAFIVVIPTVTAGAIQVAVSPICQNNVPVLTELTAPSGGDPATYVYKWYIDSTFSGTPVWKEIANSNVADLSNAPKLSSEGIYHFIRSVQSGKCGDTTTAIEVKTIPGMDPGFISTAQTICYNDAPASLIDSVPASGGTGVNPQYTYQWEQSGDGSNFNIIAGQTDPLKFTPGNLTTDQYYRRTVSVNGSSNICDAGKTPAIKIKVYPLLDPGTIKASDDLCAGLEVNTQSLTPSSGGSLKKTYQWQKSSTATGPWTNIAGGENFNSGKLAETTYYQRITSDPTCGDTATNVYAVRINPLRNPKIVSILPNGTLCELDKNIPFTADTSGAGANGKFTWYLNTDEQTQSTGKTILLSDWETPKSTIRVKITPDRTSYPCYGPDHDTLITVDVTGKQLPKVVLNEIKSICEGQSITFTATTSPAFNSSTDMLVWGVNGNAQSSFDNALQFTSATLNDEDEITVEYTSGSNCAETPDADTSKIITVYEIPVATIDNSPNIICLGDTLPLKALGDFSSVNPDTTFQWFLDGKRINGANKSVYNALQTGKYTVEISNGAICKDTSAEKALEVQNPGVDAGPDQNIMEGDTVTLQGKPIGPYSYSIIWTPIDSLKENINRFQPTVNPSLPTLYTIAVTTPEGCEATDQVMVNVFLPITIPNAFSPNNDGKNDTWVIEGLETYPQAEVRVFNRWGNMVFESKGYSEIQQWKGTTLGGSPLPVAVYYYVVDPKNPNGGDVLTGFVTVIR